MLITRKTLLVFAVFFSALGVVVSPGNASAASFDCTKASTLQEKAVCGSPALSALDEKLADAYKSARALSADSVKLKTEQVDWIKEVRKCQSDESCINSLYIARLQALSLPSANIGQKQIEPSKTSVISSTVQSASSNRTVAQNDKVSSATVDIEKIPSPPLVLSNDSFLSGYLLDKQAWKRGMDAQAIVKRAMDSRDPNDLEIIALEQNLDIALKDNQLSADKDSRDIFQKKLEVRFDAAKQVFDACEKSKTDRCKWKMPSLELKLLASHATNDRNFRYFMRDGIRRHKELADEIGYTPSMTELGAMYGRFSLFNPQGINWINLDSQLASPEEFNIGLATEYYRKAIRSGDLGDGRPCKDSAKLLTEGYIHVVATDYLKKIGLIKVCKYNFDVLRIIDPDYKALSPERVAAMNDFHARLIAGYEKIYDDRRKLSEKYPYVAIVECKLGSTTTFFSGCFNSKIGTKSGIQLNSNDKISNFNIINDFSGDGVGGRSPTGLVLNLTKKFKLSAQKAAEAPLTLNVRIVNSFTGEKIEEKTAIDQFQMLVFGN